jgi:hypothetical protein
MCRVPLNVSWQKRSIELPESGGARGVQIAQLPNSRKHGVIQILPIGMSITEAYL